MAQVIWSPSARTELLSIHDRIAADSKVYARRFVKNPLERIEFLGEHPMIGHAVKEIGKKEIREIAFNNFRLIHRTAPGQIQILRILHPKRMLAKTSLK